MAWHCPKIAQSWVEIFAFINEILDLRLEPSPLLGLLGYTKNIPVESQCLVAMLLLAKRRVAMSWGRARVPQTKSWIADVTYCQEQRNTFWELMPVASRRWDIWGPFQDWIRALVMTGNSEAEL